MVEEQYTDEFCALMNMAHFYTWSFFHERFGVSAFPWKRAFFDDINVRHCVCKEANENVNTISNTIPEPYGESLTINHLIERNAFERLKLLKK